MLLGQLWTLFPLIHKSHIFFFFNSCKLKNCAWNYISLCTSSETSSFEVEEYFKSWTWVNALKFSLIVTGHCHIVKLQPFCFYGKLRWRTVPSVFCTDIVTANCSDFIAWFLPFSFVKARMLWCHRSVFQCDLLVTSPLVNLGFLKHDNWTVFHYNFTFRHYFAFAILTTEAIIRDSTMVYLALLNARPCGRLKELR